MTGNVNIYNLKRDRFTIQLLYWNQTPERFYSDRFIRIEQPDLIVTGIGFDSNQQMTEWEIDDMGGIFYVDEKETNSHEEPVDSVK